MYINLNPSPRIATAQQLLSLPPALSAEEEDQDETFEIEELKKRTKKAPEPKEEHVRPAPAKPGSTPPDAPQPGDDS